MKVAATVLWVVLGLAGAVFTGQGAGYIKGSFMTGSTLWEAIGAVLLLVAAIALWLMWRPRAAPRP